MLQLLNWSHVYLPSPTALADALSRLRSDRDSHNLRQPALVGLVHLNDAEVRLRKKVRKLGHCPLTCVVVAQHLCVHDE